MHLIAVVVQIQVSTRSAGDTVLDPGVVIVVAVAVAVARVLHAGLPGAKARIVSAHETDVDVLVRASTIELYCTKWGDGALHLIGGGTCEAGTRPGTACGRLLQSAGWRILGAVGMNCRPGDKDWRRLALLYCRVNIGGVGRANPSAPRATDCPRPIRRRSGDNVAAVGPMAASAILPHH